MRPIALLLTLAAILPMLLSCARRPSPAGRPAPLSVSLDAKGSAAVDGEAVDAEALSAHIKRASIVTRDPDGLAALRVVIRAPAQTPYGHVQRVMAVCAQHYVPYLSLAVGEDDPIRTPLPISPPPNPEVERPQLHLTMRIGGDGEVMCKAGWRLTRAIEVDEVAEAESVAAPARSLGKGGVGSAVPVDIPAGVPAAETPEDPAEPGFVPVAQALKKVEGTGAEVIIDAEGSVPFGSVVEAIKTCRKRGLANVVFATPRETAFE